MSHAAELGFAIDVAEEAGKHALEGFRNTVDVQKKGRIDLVTNYDLACEMIIRERLRDAFPNDRVVGEEGDATGAGERVWYVDPIDGTTNFAHGSPVFSVSIAFYEGNVGKVGVVAAPALGVTWSASAGAGCHRRNCHSGQNTQCQVSETQLLEESVIATGFPYDRATNPENNLAQFSRFLPRVRGVRRMGSAAIDLAMVADGTFDFYWERSLRPWDMGAGLVLVAEAGGKLTDYNGGPTDVQAGRVVASNGRVHDEGLKLLAG